MAIFSSNSLNKFIAFFIASFVITNGAGTASAANKKDTEPTTEVFDVTTKDLPSGENPNNIEIPPPNFQEFDEDVFLGNTKDNTKTTPPEPPGKITTAPETKSEPAPSTATTSPSTDKPVAVAPAPEPVKTASPQQSTDSKTAKEPGADNNLAKEIPTPKKPEAIPATTPDKPEETKEPPKVNRAAQQPTTNAEVEKEQTSPIAVIPPEDSSITKGQENTQPQPPSMPVTSDTNIVAPEEQPATTATVVQPPKDSEESAYEKLRSHLNAFLSGTKGAGTEIAKANTDTPPAIPSSPAQQETVNNTVPQNPDITEAEKEVKKTETPQAIQPSEKETAAIPDDFEDFLAINNSKENDTKEKTPPKFADNKTNNVEPVVANKETQSSATTPPVQQAQTPPPAPQQQKEEVTNTAPQQQQAASNIAPQVTASAPAVKDKPVKKVDIIEPLPEQHEDQEIAEDTPNESSEKIKLSAADKAYIELLEKKREQLPESRRLSEDTKEVIEGLSKELIPDVPKKKTVKHIKVAHGNKGKPGKEEDGVIKSQNKMNISVRTNNSEKDYEKTSLKLGKAYKALLVGQTAAAISIYKDVLEREPNNRDAMFGLATAYHKNSQFEQARKIYTDILKKEPADKEALNNFLVLVAEEAPEDALIELEKLERINSDFSPIAAQIAMINLRLGHPDKAARYLRRAILLSPENISYKYNLAVIYDSMEKEAQALQLYHKVIEAVRAGAVINGSVDQVLQRASYLERKISSGK